MRVRPTTIPDVLRYAAAYIGRYGWTRDHRLYDAHDGCQRDCPVHRSGMYPASILGALRCALAGRPKWYLTTTPDGTTEAYAASLDHLNHHLSNYGAAGVRAPVIPWSHAPRRTPAEVVAALRAAASTASAQPFDGPAGLAPVVPLRPRTSRSDRPTAGLFDLSRPA
ncbi:DUF6197 family protein [Polymorphospora rubra]|uniref:Uncharacterized protein n=1 Tax=Polymorphospora rubra TaxID=338584 RepID=A0A810MZK6_9ACTN|nr:hypothetical protein [Polymorphospora rubra]BCJ65874.1 hypothetical protein Prubr_28950 [Polymorphospora rubra]